MSSAPPAGEWEQAAWDAGAPTAGGRFAAQQLFASQDWKVQQQRRARIATSGRWVLFNQAVVHEVAGAGWPACTGQLLRMLLTAGCGAPIVSGLTNHLCRALREAFGEAYDEQAAARAGKRQKRSGAASAAAAAAAAAADPTRARVETLLAASSQGVVRRAAAVAAQDVIQEAI